MKKSDQFKLIAGTVLKAIVGMPTKDKYEAKTNKPRPFVFSRRMINGCLFTVSTILALAFGINIPPETVTALLDAGTQLYTVAMENKPVVVALWTAAMTIWGHIKRDK